MKNSKMIAAVLAVTALSLLAAAGVYVYNLNKMPTTSEASRDSQQTVIDGEFAQLEAQYTAMEGEAYDKVFVTGMIAHHQGAVSMANVALTKAKHPELKDIANSIISAQLEEIRQLQTWRSQWGYASGGETNMAGMDHSNNGMEQQMTTMTNELNSKSGDEFDAAFIDTMIAHHQSAIAMARPGIKNASRQEVKDMAAAIVDAQTKEISQLQQWREEWGYNDTPAGRAL